MREPLSVYTLVPERHTASHYYRCEVPLKTAAEIGLPVRALIDTNSADTPQEKRVQNLCNADIVLMYQPIGEAQIQNFRAMQNFLPMKRGDGWKWPPSLVIESDDNLFNVSPLNTAYRGLGTRDMEGNEIPVGHHIGVVRNGERKILWQDGHDGFSILRNRQLIASYRTLLRMVDLVSCSTPSVKEAIEREVKPRRIEIYPNLVRFNDYEQLSMVEDPKKVKILWQGGIAHYEDWYPLRDALGNITKKYPEVQWIIWGSIFPWVKELIPPHRYTFMPWCAYQEYKLRLSMVGHDIALAPLQEHLFNKCRSAIKLYEASVLKKDIPLLAQNSGAYKSEIQDGKTGLLFSDPREFEEKLGLLIENRKLRQEIGRNAKDWVHENRDAVKVVPKIVAKWEEIREDRKREQPHATEKLWKEMEERARQESEDEIEMAEA